MRSTLSTGSDTPRAWIPPVAAIDQVSYARRVPYQAWCTGNASDTFVSR
jgi:hypothetical protein